MKLVKEIVSRAGAVHFRRWSVLNLPWFNVYLHCIYRSDADNDPHDHPWNFSSLVLKGGYREKVWHADGSVVEYLRRPGSFATRTIWDFHQITLLDKPTWTLVVVGTKVHEPWGYLTLRGWIDHETYREEKRQKG